MGEHAETVVEYTIGALRDAIREGRLAPGQRLVVADVTKMFKVSAGPVREAIRRLTGEGLVDITPHRGATVRQFSAEEVREIFEVREVIEGLAARLAAAKIDEGFHRVRLQACRDAMAEAAASMGPSYVAHNQELHELIYTIAGNGKVNEIAGQLTLPIYRMRYHHLIDPTYIQTSMAEHERLIDAILAGDETLAERLMREHIGHSRETMIAALHKPGGF